MQISRNTKEKKFPLRLQRGSIDCGPACLRMIAEFYGKKFSHNDLCSLFNISEAGVNLQNIIDVAEAIGLQTISVRTSFEKLKKHAQLPCMALVGNNHSVVVYKIENEKSSSEETLFVYVADPINGFIKYSEKEFKNTWISETKEGFEKGIAVLSLPTPVFYKKNQSFFHSPPKMDSNTVSLQQI